MLIAICLFIAGEIQPLITNYKLTSFANSSYNIGQTLTKDESYEEFNGIIEAFTIAAEENDIGIFIAKYESKSNLEEIEHFYCAGNAADYLADVFDDNYGYDSVINGKIHYDISTLNDISQLDSYITLYFCGDDQSVSNAQDYIGKYLKTSEMIEKKTQGNIYLYIEYGTLILALVLIMMFGVSDVNIKKKEYVIKYIYGESKLSLIGKYYITDAAVYCAIIAAETFAVMQLNSVACCLKEIIVFAICVLIGDLLCYLPLFKADPVYALKGQENKKKVLSTNRMIKIAVSAFIVCVIAAFITLLNDSMTYIKTADFFEQHSDYSFCYAEKDDDRETTGRFVDNNYRIACDYYDHCQPLLINRDSYMIYDYQEDGANGYYIFANANAVDYLKTAVSEFKNTEITADYIIIAPEDMINDDFIDKNLMCINSRYNVYIDNGEELYNRDNVQIIKTERSYKVFATDNDKESEMGIYKNEPVIVCTVPENESEYPPEEMNLGSQPYYMLRISDDLKNELIDKNGYTRFVRTNCKEQYDHFWRMNRLGLIYFGAFSAVLIILEIIVLSFIVKLEFDLNKEELCIKKVLGYTLLSRYGVLIATTLLSSFICCIISTYVLGMLDTNTPAVAAVVVSLLLLILEFVIIVVNAIKLEKASIPKILKGGAL